MKIGLKTILAAGLGLAMAQGSSFAAAGTTNTPPGIVKPGSAAIPEGTFKDDKEKASYGVGMYFGNMIKGNNLDVDLETVIGAMKDALAGKDMKLTEAQGRDAIRSYQMEAQKKAA